MIGPAVLYGLCFICASLFTCWKKRKWLAYILAALLILSIFCAAIACICLVAWCQEVHKKGHIETVIALYKMDWSERTVA